MDARNQGPLAKIYTQRRDTEVGMVVAYHLGDRLGTSCVGLGEIVKNGTVERGEVGTCRNDVVLLKIRESLLQKIGFYFITKTHAKAGRVLV